MSPYEIVVFDVGKNQITGYLSTPKSAAHDGSQQHSGSITTAACHLRRKSIFLRGYRKGGSRESSLFFDV